MNGSHPSKKTRQFQVYNVGLFKTGTQSISHIFQSYQTAHEFMFEQTLQAIFAWKNKQLSDEKMKAFIRFRDSAGNLEMDSAGFLGKILPFLLSEFPKARFIFTIRDCCSWMESILNHLIWFQHTHPAFLKRYSPYFVSEFEPYNADKKIDVSKVMVMGLVKNSLPSIILSLISYWTEENLKILQALPLHKSLIMRTDQITQSIDKIADFIGIPSTTLNQKESKQNVRENKQNLFDDIDKNGFLSKSAPTQRK